MRDLDYIFDGAMSTYFQSITGNKTSCELANIRESQKIIDIHKEYIEVGCNAIKTNTFGLNQDLVKDKEYLSLLIKKAISNAKEASNESDISIFGDIGPINVENDEYLELVKIFIDGGITHFLFETQVEYSTLKEAIKYIRDNVKNSVVIVSFAANQDGFTRLGYHYEQLIEQASKDADYVGLNCICGPTHAFKLLEKLDSSKYNLIAMPNAGYFDGVDDNFIYNAEYFASKMIEIIGLGIKVAGACCGSTPWHLKKIIEGYNKESLTINKNKPIEVELSESKSIVKEIFDKQKKLVAVEFSTPLKPNCENLVDLAYRVKEKEVDLITLVDSPLAQAKADSFMMAAYLQNKVKVKVMPHLTCRDKNQIAIKGSLIGGNAFGIDNVLALSGDAIAKTDRDFSKGVFSFNSNNLINYVSELNKDTFNKLPYYIGGALNVNATNFDVELKRAQLKIENNVDYFISQSIFTKQAIENLKKANEVLDVPIVAGLYPVISLRNALFLKNEVKGIDIPNELIKQFEEVTSNRYKEISVNYIFNVIDSVYNYCDGFYISTPLNKIDYVCEIIDYIKGKEN
ncbi:MAG: bifunctional homocysteine S-methyltransferase/methylenetetrahydrofolate reductase [Erysipelotrichales bacterium]